MFLTLPTGDFKKMKAFARFKNKTWCMDLAHVDQFAEVRNGEMCLIVRQNLF